MTRPSKPATSAAFMPCQGKVLHVHTLVCPENFCQWLKSTGHSIMVQDSKILQRGRWFYYTKSLMCFPIHALLCTNTEMCVPKGSSGSLRPTGQDADCWVLPMIPAFFLLGNHELVYWTDIVCLFRVVFCNYVPAGLTGSNNMLLSSANTASVLRLIRPGLGGAPLD